RRFHHFHRICLQLRCGRPLQFSIGGTGNTPAKQISQEKAVAQANAEVAIEEDNFVQALIHDFGATIIPNSIKPI
ncbi:MAG: hypothetical protein B7Y72_06040, partial [Mehylophilales bacterium 35-46-6]